MGYKKYIRKQFASELLSCIYFNDKNSITVLTIFVGTTKGLKDFWKAHTSNKLKEFCLKVKEEK